MIRFCLSLLAVWSLVADAAQAQVKLERKLRENSTTVVESSMKLTQNLKIAGMNQDTASHNSRVTRATSGQRDGLGRLKVEERIDELNVSVTTPGAEYLFDSKSPETKGSSPLEAMRPLHKALVQQVVTLVHDKDNALTDVEFDQQFLNGLDPNLQSIIKGQLDPETLKNQAKQKVAQLPTDPVQPGDSWERTESLNLGSGQTMTFRSKYRYEGAVEKDGKTLDKITFDVLEVGFAIENSPVQLQVKGTKLKPEKSGGSILFDRELGNVVEEDETAHVLGTIDFEINGMPLPAELDLKIESKMIRRK